jgi:lipopolysaccharide export LptBFGC system permease protein LptF
MSFFTYDRLIPYSRKILDCAKDINQQFVYVDKDAKGKPQQIIIVSKFDGDKIYDVNVLKLSSNNDAMVPLLRNIYIAPLAIYKNNTIYLLDGTNYNINNENIFKEISHFDNMEVLHNEKAKALVELMKYSVQRDRNLTNAEMSHYLKLLKQEGMDEEYRSNLNKYYQRFFDSISCIFLAILGCILGYTKPREQRLLGFTAAVGVIFAYYIIIPLIDLLAQKGILWPIITASIPTSIVVAAIFASLYFKNIRIEK